jgi:peroxiredoxin
MSLEDELERRRRMVAEQLPRPDLRIIDDTIDRLRMLQVAENALNVGDLLPDFALPDKDHRIVRSSELLDRGPLVLAFFRGQWCPYCDAAMRALEQARPRIEAHGATLVGVLPEKPEQLRRTVSECGLGFVLLSDTDGNLARFCGVRYELPEAHVELYRRSGIDLPDRHAGADWSLPLPASYVVRTDGLVSYAFLNPDWTFRAEPEELIAAVARESQAAAAVIETD